MMHILVGDIQIFLISLLKLLDPIQVYVEDAWTASPCETEGITPLPDGTALINCQCGLPGFVAVFLTLDSRPLAVMHTTNAGETEIQFT